MKSDEEIAADMKESYASWRNQVAGPITRERLEQVHRDLMTARPPHPMRLMPLSEFLKVANEKGWIWYDSI